MTSLERAFEDAAGPLIQVCSTCAGPSANTSNLVPLADKQDLRTCADCDGALHPDGRTALRLDGEGGVMPVIILRGVA